MATLKELVYESCVKLSRFSMTDITAKFKHTEPNEIKRIVRELKDEQKIYMHGEKRGAYYTLTPGSQDEAKAKEEDLTVEQLKEQIYNFAKSVDQFKMSDIFEKIPDYKEYLIRNLVAELKDEKRIFQYGERRGAFYSISNNIKVEETKQDERDGIKNEILKFATTKNDWFIKRELDEALANYPPHVLRQKLYELIDEDQIASIGSRRWTRYGLVTLDASEILEDDADPTIKNNIFEFIKKNKVSTIPMLMEEFELSRTAILNILNELVEEEKIYKEGSKKTTRYVDYDANPNEIDDILSTLKTSKPKNYKDSLHKFLEEGFRFKLRFNHKTIVFDIITTNFIGDKINSKSVNTLNDLKTELLSMMGEKE